MKRKIVLTTVSLVCLFILGLSRDYIFVETNKIILFKSKNPYACIEANLIQSLISLSLTKLLIFKWGLTVVYTSLYFFTASFFLAKLKIDSKKLLIYLYALLLVAATILYIVGIIVNETESLYHLARYLMGILQSPIPFFIVYAFFSRLKPSL